MQPRTVWWEKLRTKNSARVENALRRHFKLADAYVYGRLIRVRVVDFCFSDLIGAQRRAEKLVLPILNKLPPDLERLDYVSFCFTPDEMAKPINPVNKEFEWPEIKR